MSEWRSVSTPPAVASTDALVFSPDRGVIKAVWWEREEDLQPLGWYEYNTPDEDPIEEPITHWMPLPSPPEADCVDCNGEPCWEDAEGNLYLVDGGEDAWAIQFLNGTAPARTGDGG